MSYNSNKLVLLPDSVGFWLNSQGECFYIKALEKDPHGYYMTRINYRLDISSFKVDGSFMDLKELHKRFGNCIKIGSCFNKRYDTWYFIIKDSDPTRNTHTRNTHIACNKMLFYSILIGEYNG